MKTYKTSPLPFLGQKRQFIAAFKQALDNIDGDGEGWTIVDVFGGSGLLSHTAKRYKPKARVIYNDYDNFVERLENIKDTNRLRKIIYELTKDFKHKQDKLPEDLKQTIIKEIKNFDGFIDLQALKTWILFSAKEVDTLEDLFKKTFYAKCIKNDYPDIAHDYLDGLEIVSESFEKLLPKFSNKEKTLLVFDPPYLFTQQHGYKNSLYGKIFGLVDFHKLMQFVRPPFIFFSSDKTEFVNYIDFLIEQKQHGYERFENYQKKSKQATINYHAKYKDFLIYKF